MPSHHFRHQLPDQATSPGNARFTLMLTFPSGSCKSESIAPHFSRTCATRVGDGAYYRLAYTRWKAQLAAGGARHEEWALCHRALIGVSEPSLWQSNLALHSIYGVPVLAGSACKGLASHFARAQLDLTEPEVECLFGDKAAMGKARFHDAWWVPGSGPTGARDQPLVREQVTPHHPKFLNSKGSTAATPFDSPTPIPQLATHGKFLFAASGDPLIAEYALNILRVALEMEGIGARTPEYGCIDAEQP